MVATWLHRLAYLLLGLVVLSVEQVYGLPLLFMAMVGILTPPKAWSQVAVTLVASLALATVYHISFMVSFLLLMIVVLGFRGGERWLKSQTFRILLLSGLGASIVGALKGVEPGLGVWLTGLVSVLIVGLMTQVWFVMTERGQQSFRGLTPWITKSKFKI